MTFSVVDNETGKEADVEMIALKEEWAKGLIYCDMEGFAIEEDGSLVLLDECGGVAYCPDGRFTIVFDEQSEGEWLEQVRVSKEGKPLLRHYKCNLCGVYLATQANYCPNCGAKMKEG